MANPTTTDAIWTRLTDGVDAPWLDEIRTLPVAGDEAPQVLDIWSVAFTAELKNPDRRETARQVLSRLVRLSEDRARTDDPRPESSHDELVNRTGDAAGPPVGADHEVS